jgi:DNA integrity scanning protein DisA with diadenylate cyclase activity
VTSVRWQSVVDFLVLAAAFYGLLRWARQARALRLALGVVSLHAAALLASHLDLVVTSWVLDAFAILAIVLLLLIFQPEIRRAFMRLDAAIRLLPRPVSILPDSNQAIATAAFDMAQDKWALYSL